MEEEDFTLNTEEKCITKFNKDTMNFLKWLNSLEYLFDILKIEDDDKGKFLLSMVEPSILQEIEEKLSPTNPSDLPYDDLINALSPMFSEHEGEHAWNYRFLVRDQLPQESLQHYVLTLRKLLSKCSAMIERTENLKNRFIYGLQNEEISEYLKERSEEITLAIAVSIAKQMELTKKE